MTDYCDNKYGVPNSDGTELYIVDSSLGCCSCPDGMTGKLCKHQAAVMRLFNAAFPNAPTVTAEACHTVASMALGDDCPPVDFYQSLQHGGSPSVPSNSNLQVTECSNEHITQPSSTNTSRNSDTLQKECDMKSMLKDCCQDQTRCYSR